MNCFSFQPGSWPIHAKYIKIPQALVITTFNRMNASGNQSCVASPFVISLLSLSYGRVLILPLPFFTPTPLMTPSSPNRPNTKPLPLQGQCCYTPNSDLSEWSSVPRPGPRPGSRHSRLRKTVKDTLHTYRNYGKKVTPIVLPISKYSKNKRIP